MKSNANISILIALTCLCVTPCWAQEPKLVRSFEVQAGTPRCFAISPDGKYIVTGGVGDADRGSGKFGFYAHAEVYDLAKGKRVSEFFAHENTILAAAFTPDGKHLVTGGADEVVKVFDFEKRKLLRTLKGHDDLIYRIAISPDGRRIASGSYDGTARIWDFDTGKQLFNLEEHKNRVSAVAFSPDGNTLATGCWDEKVRLYDVKTGKQTAALEGHTSWVISLQFSPDGKLLASGAFGTESEAIVWDVATKEKKLDLDAGTYQGAFVRFTNDQKHIVTVGLYLGFNGYLKRWSIAGKEEASVRIRGLIWAADFLPDGKMLAYNASDEIQIWDVKDE